MTSASIRSDMRWARSSARCSIERSPAAGVGAGGSLASTPSISQLVDPLRLVEVLQPALSDRMHGDTLRDGGADERPRRLGEEDAAARGRAAETRGADDVEAVVALLADRRLAGVEAHAHADVHPLRPRVRRVRALRLDRGRDRVARAREGEEERVALRVDLDAAAVAERLAHEPPVVGEHVAVPVAEPLHQRGGALDVAEDEGDGAGRERRHRPARYPVDASAKPSYRRLSGDVTRDELRQHHETRRERERAPAARTRPAETIPAQGRRHRRRRRCRARRGASPLP